ncbi:MAG: hypothetical protein WC030_02410 [Candidatus Paceibacterota bacterium]
MAEFQPDSCLVAIQAFENPFDDHSRCYQDEIVVTSKEEAVSLLERMVAEQRASGLTVVHASAHLFTMRACEGSAFAEQCVVDSIASYHKIFQVDEPGVDRSYEVSHIFESPNPEWRQKLQEDVAGTDNDGDGWFLRYRTVTVGAAWPEDTIHEPQMPS